MKARSVAVSALLLLVLSGVAHAQAVAPRVPGQAPAGAAAPAAAPAPVVEGKTTQVAVERKGRSNSDIYLGTYLSLDRDCKVGAAPRFEMVTEPKNGKLRTRANAINLRDVPGAPRRNCIGTSPSGVGVFYRSDRKFSGEVEAIFRMVYPNGDKREITAKITVQ